MKNFFTLIAATLLFGCTTTSYVQSPDQLHKTNGYVFVSLPKGSGEEGLRLKSIESGISYDLIKRKGKVPSVGLWVPAGTYKLAKWGQYDLIGYPIVNVEPGRMTELGSLIEMSVGGLKFVVLPIRSDEFASETDSALKELDQYFLKKEPIQWIASTTPPPIEWQAPSLNMGLIAELIAEWERQRNKPSISQRLLAAKSTDEFLNIGKSITPPIGYEPAVDTSGRYLFFADFGQLRTRNKNGEWGNIDTGSLKRIVAVEATQKVITVGYVDGGIRSSSDGGKTWRDIKTVGDQRIMDIDFVAGRWFILTSTEVMDTSFMHRAPRFNQVKVYSATRDDLSDLEVIKTIVPRVDFRLGLRAEKTADAYYVMVTPDFLKLDVNSMTWASIKTPEDVYGFHVTYGPDKITAFTMFPSNLFVTTDGGNTWVKRAAVPKMGTDVLFQGKDEGQAVRWNASAFSGVYEKLNYDFENDRWGNASELHAACNRVFSDGRQIDKFCISKGGSIFSNINSKWTLEFASD